MGGRRGRDEIVERYGGLWPADEAIRKSRWSEIDRLEALLRSGTLDMAGLEQTQRRLCELKGVDFGEYDPPDEDI